jgi:hypothetical protein
MRVTYWHLEEMLKTLKTDYLPETELHDAVDNLLDALHDAKENGDVFPNDNILEFI